MHCRTKRKWKSGFLDVLKDLGLPKNATIIDARACWRLQIKQSRMSDDNEKCVKLSQMNQLLKHRAKSVTNCTVCGDATTALMSGLCPSHRPNGGQFPRKRKKLSEKL
jgi:hypothetical protein